MTDDTLYTLSNSKSVSKNGDRKSSNNGDYSSPTHLTHLTHFDLNEGGQMVTKYEVSQNNKNDVDEIEDKKKKDCKVIDDVNILKEQPPSLFNIYNTIESKEPHSLTKVREEIEAPFSISSQKENGPNGPKKLSVSSVSSVSLPEEISNNGDSETRKPVTLSENKSVTSVSDLPDPVKKSLIFFQEAGIEVKLIKYTWIGFPEEMAELAIAEIQSLKVMSFYTLAIQLGPRSKGFEHLRSGTKILFPWLSYELKKALLILHKQGRIRFFHLKSGEIYESENEKVYERLRFIRNWQPAAVAVANLLDEMEEK